MNRNRVSAAVGVALVAGLLAWYWDEMSPTWRGVVVGLAAIAAVVVITRPRTDDSNPEAGPLLEIVERVVADETRRAWNPSTLPWVPVGAAAPKPLLLVPAADYHLGEVVPLVSELNSRGVQTRVAIGASPWARTWQSLAWEGIEVFELSEPDQIADQVSAVLVMKDTGSLGLWVNQCRDLGLVTIGKVEGAQDFWDADTPEARRPYRNLDFVLCQGQFDVEALEDRPTSVVGSTRLERLWWSPAVDAAEPLAVINLNFVYGVRTADRKLWLDTAVEACEMAGIPYVISTHPAEKSRVGSGRRMTSISASRLLPHASVLISRFSTVPFEAMARGVPFVYHNPHGETVRTFADAMDGFDTTTSSGQLSQVLTALRAGPTDHRLRYEPFFTHHIDVDGSRRSEQRSADAIAQWITG